MTDKMLENTEPNNRGAVLKLFGVILIILGALNSMLAWRGGFEVISFYTLLIATGALLCLIGTIRHQRST